MTDRLISPQKRRLYPNAKTGTGFSGAGVLAMRQREGLEVGQLDQVTWNALVKLGWVVYDGPAKTDEYGYIVPNTMTPPPTEVP